MSIIAGYKNQLEKLLFKKAKLNELSDEIPEVRYITTQIDGQIRDMETRIHKLTSISASVHCYQCQQWVDIDLEDKMVEINNEKICPNCIKTISQVYTTQEAEKIWGLTSGTIKQDCLRNKLDSYIETGLIRKSGKYWLVHELVRAYYQKKND